MLVESYMYHDIRDYQETSFGNLFSKRYELKSYMSRQKFIKQIDAIKNNSDIISTSDFLELDKSDKGKYSILTFDDGLLDHYNILDILMGKQAVGTFFIPCEAVVERKMVLSHKIQFILAAVDEKKLVSYIRDKLNDFNRDLWNKYSVSKWKNNWWSPEMVFVTNVLRNHHQGKEITNDLFDNFVTSNEKEICADFYLNTSQLEELVSNGMEIGGHGHMSENLSTLSLDMVEEEILKSSEFVSEYYTKHRSFSYPNGGYNDSVLKYMKQYGYDLAFTTIQKPLEMDQFDPLTIPRYDASQWSFV